MVNNGRPQWRDLCHQADREAMLGYASDAVAFGDANEAGHWYIRIAERFDGDIKEHIEAILPKVEAQVEQGDPAAKALLAELLRELKADAGRIFQLFEESAAAGVPEGIRGLGYLLVSAEGSLRDLRRASELFKKGAELGDAFCAYNLAVNYREGHGVTPNAVEYLRWLRYAADRCLPEACASLADVLDRQRKPDEAWQWHLRAAELGHLGAQLNVATRYRDGHGVDVDLVEATRWYLAMQDKRVSNGLKAIMAMVESGTGPDPTQIREAGRLARQERVAELVVSKYFPDA